jgi:AmmeMemoRadiSam system protein B
MKIRKTGFSGSWYPDTAAACEMEIREFLAQGKTAHLKGRKFLGGIVPHAGWYFSGSIACNVIAGLSREDSTDAVVLFGMHLHPGSPAYIMPEGAWETPFGPLEVEERLAKPLTERFPFHLESYDRFTQDNTIELQLPFVKYFFKNAKVLAIGTPPSEKSLDIAAAVADISKQLNLKIKVIGSTDLTHYGSNYGFSPKGSGPAALDWVRNENDRSFIDTVLGMNPAEIIRQGLDKQNACCAGAAASAVAAAKAIGAQKAESLAYATSYDKHPGASFVGYVGIVFE